MRWTQTLIPTLKETPQEAVIKSHRLMLRAGLVRKLASGTYSYLPLGLKALKKAENIIRDEMDKAGALEILMPALHPLEIWQETGRDKVMGEGMFKFQDRHGKWNSLGPTHEEIVTDIARREIHSYKQLPLTVYQIQTKFRDEARPRSGIVRSREFVMKDAYSFHTSEESLDEGYQKMKEAYKAIFTRCGFEFYIVEADPGDMGGSGSQEFVLFSDAGEDRMVQFGDSQRVMSVEMAQRQLKGLKFPEKSESGRHSEVSTPQHSSVESVADFLKKKPSDLLKTMVYQRPDGTFFEVLIRGDHEVSEFKLKKLEPGSFMASRDAIEKLGMAFGFSGPFASKLKTYIDEDVLEMKNFITGGNKRDVHRMNVNLGDFECAEKIVGDFRQVAEGDKSLEGQALKFKTAIELGHIFKLNLRYSKPMKANVLDASGKEVPMIMGCYGIGVNRILAAAIEQYADDKGIIWPKNLSPYEVHVVMIDVKDAQAQEIVKTLETQGFDMLIDDRDGTAGVKFNDADLIGIPLRVILGPKNLKNGKAEIKLRKTGESILVDIADLANQVRKQLAQLG